MTKAGTVKEQSSWRWFPLGLIGSLIVVMIANGGMLYAALHTFPGSAGEDGLDLGNRYDRVLAETARQASLGWRVQAEPGADGHILLALTDRDGKALEAARIEAQAARPVGPASTTPLTLRRMADGSFASQEGFAPGQWTVTVRVTLDGQVLNATEYVVLR